jgi:3-oxoacyl-[acyl-carrier-protein] synthase-3
MLRHAAITGWGSYLPERIMSNRDLEALVDTSDEWIRTRTGICKRHIAGAGEVTSSMCARAAERALACARLSAADVDLVICATTTPDCLLPATGCLVQQRIGATHAGAFDLNSACTGFLQGLIVGAQFIQGGTCQRVLVVAGETLSRFLNWKDRDTCVLFGDGAGAVVLEATDQQNGVLSTVFGCRGDAGHILAIEGGGSARPASAQTLASDAHFVAMRGNELFKLAVRSMSHAATEALAKASVAVSNLRKVIPHQANVRIIRAVQDALALPTEKVFVNVDHCGNTGSASVAIALAEFLAKETVEPGDNLLLAAFGGGLTWAAALYSWADVDAIVARRGQECSSDGRSQLEEQRQRVSVGPSGSKANNRVNEVLCYA